MELIDKAVVAEIERRLKYNGTRVELDGSAYFAGKEKEDEDILSFLDTLEVKGVDLEKEIDDYINEHFSECEDGVLISDANSKELTLLDVMPMARHFFELGLKAQKQETELSKVKGFLVRDKDDYTAIYAEKPHRGKTEWVNGNDSCLMTINDARLVPDIEFEDEPVEVELTLRRIKEDE